MTVQDLQLPIPIDELKTLLQEHGVAKAYLYGSYARNQATKQSDLDLLVDLQPGKTYMDLGALQYKLEQRVPGGVDITTKLNKHFEPYIKPDLIEVL
ncbi:MAG: nucleotidyltransferase family protein [Candidatus Saccharimonadales bacterium]